MKKRNLDAPSFKPLKSKRPLYIGIDPGMEGGIGWVGGVENAMPMPTIKTKPRSLDLPAVKELFISLKFAWKNVYVTIEKAQAMPKQGVVSMFNYGMAYGQLLGVLAALNIPYIEVRPTEWKNKVLKGTKKDKPAAVKYCKMRYPEIDLLPGKKQKPHDGMADAICLAEYCKKEFK